MYSDWCQLSLVTRMKIANAFGIKKTGATHVSNNYVQSDGYAVKDIESVLNVKTLQEFLKSEETDARTLWNLMVDKVEGKTPAAKFEEQVVKDLNRIVPEVRWNPEKEKLVITNDEKPKEESATLIPNLPPEKVQEIINNSEILNKKDNAKTKKNKQK